MYFSDCFYYSLSVYCVGRVVIDISTMIERFKEMRKQFGLSQAEFANRIHVTPAAIGNIESGKRNPSTMMLLNICHEFGVSEQWLRTGEGEMRASQDRKSEIVSFVTSTLNAPESIQFKLISLLSKLTADDWDRISELARQLAEDSGEK